MQWLKLSTAVSKIVGPVLDSTGAEYASAVIGDLSLSKNGGTLTALASAASLTYIANGYYTLALTTGNTDTLGSAEISVNKATYQMPPREFMVLPATVYDALVTNATTATGGLGDIQRIAGTAQTARDLGAITANTITHLNTIYDTDYATVYDTTNKAFLAKLGNFAMGGSSLVPTFGASTVMPRVTLVDTVTTLTNLPSIPTDWLTATGLAASAVTEIQLAITGIAGSLNLDASGNVKVSDGTGANQIDTTSGAIAHVVLCDTTTTNTDMLTAVAVWGAATRLLTAGTNIVLAKGVGVTGFTDISAAQVNAEVVDALATDTYAEPGQGAPGATISLAAKLNYLYTSWRNKKTNDGATTNLYDDAGTTVIAKQLTAVAAGTVSKAEWITGA